MRPRRLGRRAFLVLSAAVLAAPAPSAAQDVRGKLARIGRLSPVSARSDGRNLDAFRKGMRELGWAEGEHYRLELRFADGRPERLRELAADLVRDRVDLILVGSNPGALAAKQATSTIPIVMVTTGDPVGGGIVASLARPGGNLTGLTALGQVLNLKRLELVKEVAPNATRVAVLANPVSPYTAPFLRERERASRVLGFQVRVHEVDAVAKLEPAVAALVSERAEAILVLNDVMFIDQRRQIVELVNRHRLAAVYPEHEFVEVGGLVFYGASLVDMYNRAAVFADRILKGTKPADLPVEQPTKLELALNLKTAKAIGLTIPPSILARADRVIE